MSELLKAIQNLPKQNVKKHFVNIDGNEIEVTLQKKLDIMRDGEDKFTMKDNEIVLKPVPKAKTKYPILKKAKKGYAFEQGDIHWPNAVIEGGAIWQIEYE